jgi:hypothetical protein
MSRPIVEQIVESVFYEGYMLYPYRPSVKNRHRWTFGGLFPRAFSQAQATGDACAAQAECLVRGSERTTVQVEVRFLHLLARVVRQLDHPLTELPVTEEPASRPVERLQLGDRCLQTWQEAEERTLSINRQSLGSLLGHAGIDEFQFGPRKTIEPVWHEGMIGALIDRAQEPLIVTAERSVIEAAPGLFQLQLRIENRTPLRDPPRITRDAAQMRSLASTHAILRVEGGEFVSLIDPPEDCRTAAGTCQNVGMWPVLVGEEGQKDTVLCSPIILYDYPQVAQESPGNLFDGTEIDEILTLRVLTLTDDEKREATAIDDRTRELLERTESLARDQLMRLHGTIRGMKPVHEGTTDG